MDFYLEGSQFLQAASDLLELFGHEGSNMFTSLEQVTSLRHTFVKRGHEDSLA